MTKRPSHLPDFRSPPLTEVVIGVQFAPLPGYSFPFLSGLYERFKREYPKITEQPLLPPQFEMFGGGGFVGSHQIEFGPMPLQNRTWLVSERDDHLLQIQPDRFMMNWRANPLSEKNDYPRFEAIFDKFYAALKEFGEASSLLLGSQVNINQAEVSYFNIIELNDFSDVCHWLNVLDRNAAGAIESLGLSVSEIIFNAEKPIARLHQRAQTVYWGNAGERKGVQLEITFRGGAGNISIQDLKDFLFMGREKISLKFLEITTDSAQKSWGRL